MTKKANPIAEHKHKDIILLRDVLLAIIDTPKSSQTSAQAGKNRIEACKLLARLHHALQVDKTSVKATAQQLQGMNMELSDKEKRDIDLLIQGKNPKNENKND